ncbi:hypothetical protein BV22DRAFT_1037799 [Leucogyrophana mollusca]|uniref:Uncharacterized protein n=1 Tax=Leucogyrophana mollusca TaxID=85980 RepID=A0ACB8BB50_9AGAM|nr:hypothetical protein BV22DRAFT_1037799 [Leucogyrophana mollusca]
MSECGDLSVPSASITDWCSLMDKSVRDAAKYLPTDTVTTEDGRLKPSSPVQCHLGPFNRVEMNMFDSLALSSLRVPNPTSSMFVSGNTRKDHQHEGEEERRRQSRVQQHWCLAPEVGVHRVVWNSANGLGGAPLLAPATESGLCGVDWLLGRFIRDKVPYVDVPSMRKEVDGVADDDSRGD